MGAGDLRERITIQQRTNGEDPLGQAITGFVDLLPNVRAKVEQLGGRELLNAGAERAENTARITIRYRPGIVEKMRVLHGSVVYDITSCSDLTGRRRWLEIMVKSGMSNG